VDGGECGQLECPAACHLGAAVGQAAGEAVHGLLAVLGV
jgi:hypothetical protein